VVVWPVYLGAASGHAGDGPLPANEPYDDPNYRRGQILWTKRSSVTQGRAVIQLPKGVWTHYVFCSGDQPATMMRCVHMEQPVVFDRPGFLEVDPIHNHTVIPRLGA
jgi:hypothetical protein